MRAAVWLGLCFVAVLALASCGPAVSPAVPCNSDEECGAGEVCASGVCQEGDPLPRPDAGKRPGGDDAGGPSGDDDAGTASDDAGELPGDGGLSADDGGAVDAGVGDSGPEEGGAVDGGPLDGGFDDGGLLDAGPVDAALVDGCVRAPAALGDFVVCSVPLAAAAAQASCESMGLTLAEIDSAEDNDAITALATALDADVWIGLGDADAEGVFVWGSGAAVSYRRFNTGEPNDSPPGEDCVHLYPDGKWNDTRCSSERSYVCSAPNPALTLSEPYCLARPDLCACDTVVYGGVLYALCHDERSFTSAAVGCGALGMKPVKIEETRERDVLARQSALLEASLWIGYGDPDGDGQHRHHDGSEGTIPIYDDDASSGTCALLHPNGVVEAASCGQREGYACQLELPGEVAPDCSPFGNGDYLACNTKRTADEARAVCQRAGMDLIVIDDDDENELVRSRLAAHGSQWLGVSDRREELLFRTVANGPMTYSSFEREEPNDYGDSEDCVEMNAATGRWNDELCGQLRSFVCEPGSTLPPPFPEGPLCASLPDACPCEKRVNDGVLYLFCGSDASWAKTEAICERLGMQMLAPPNAEHDAFVRAQLSALPRLSRVWTGLTDSASEGTFVGPSGEALPYASWAYDQPNNLNGNQDCVEYLQDRELFWNDAACTQQSFVACQAPLPETSGCVDPDGDGHGVGCALGPDCDEANASVNVSALDVCNGVDDDCSGTPDDDGEGCACSLFATNAHGYWLCENAINWHAARMQCRAYDAELAVLDDETEDDLLSSLLGEAGLSRVWLGVSDHLTEGDYRTVTGAELAYTRWGDAQPNGTQNEDCVQWRASGWHDLGCTSTSTFACELP